MQRVWFERYTVQYTTALAWLMLHVLHVYNNWRKQWHLVSIFSNIIWSDLVAQQIIIYPFWWTLIRSIFGRPCSSHCCSKCNVFSTLNPWIPGDENGVWKITHANSNSKTLYMCSVIKSLSFCYWPDDLASSCDFRVDKPPNSVLWVNLVSIDSQL